MSFCSICKKKPSQLKTQTQSVRLHIKLKLIKSKDTCRLICLDSQTVAHLKFFFHSTFEVVRSIIEDNLVSFTVGSVHLDENIGICSSFGYITSPHRHFIGNFFYKKISRIVVSIHKMKIFKKLYRIYKCLSEYSLCYLELKVNIFSSENEYMYCYCNACKIAY